MTIWLDEHLDPKLATWITAQFGIPAKHVRELGYARTADAKLFAAAKQIPGLILMSKDHDMVDLLDRYGPPPQLLWLTCGNMRTARLQVILSSTLAKAIELFSASEPLVEISGSAKP